MISEEIREKFAGLLQSKQALLFCGAGISIDPPSSLPGWNALRNYTLEAIAAREPSLSFYVNDLTTLTLQSSPNRRGLIPEIVASVISQRCSGYFDSFKSLEEGLPNRNHGLIAELAAKGNLKYIITTNFDLFIEKALAEKGVAFRVLRSEDDYKTFTITEEDPIVCLLKIHGCISAPATITATVEQEALGLSANKLLALELLLPQFFFIFWGYSGEDLKIDLNYLGQVKHKDRAKGFAWNLFENETFKETPNPYVIRLTDIYDGKSIVRHSLLPSAFESFLGERIYQRPDANEVAISSARNEEHLRNFLSGWARTHVGVIDACVIFARLLNYAGLYKQELVCYERMAEHCSMSGDELQKAESELYIGQVKHTLKQETDALLAYENALKYFQQHRNISGIKNALFALGDFYADREQFDNAIEYYTQLHGLIVGEYNSLSLGDVLLKVGNVKMSQAKAEEALKSFRDAENVFSRLGAKVRLIETKLKIGKYHLGYGEWKEALMYLEEGRQIAIDLGHKSLLLDVIAELILAQGKLGKYEEAGDSISEATLLADELDDYHAQASIHRSLGIFLNDQSRKEDALTELTKAEE